MAVAQVVHADPLDPTLLTAILHRTRYLVLGDQEHAVVGPDLGVATEIVGDLLDKEPRELDGAGRLGRLRVREYVPAVEALVGLIAPCVLAQARPNVGLVHLVELLKGHCHRAPGGGDEVVLPCLGFLRTRESALAFVHFLAELVLAPELREPGAVLGLLNGHASPLPHA